MRSNELVEIIDKVKKTYMKQSSHLVQFHSSESVEEHTFFSDEPGILFVLSGELDYQIGDDEFRTLPHGEYLFYPKGVTVQLEMKKGSTHLVFPLTKKIVEYFVDLLRQYRNFSPEKLETPTRVCIMQAKWTNEIEAQLKNVLSNYLNNDDYRIHLTLCEIMYDVFPNEHMLSKISYILDMYYYPESIRKVESYLLEHYHKPIRIKNITDVANVSESHLNRLYKKYVQMSPMERLTMIRMEQAALLLRNQSMTITDVAMQVGYQSMSAFVQQFKRKYTLSPKDFQSK
ncbi:helix-turn-helix domain-containing protein [Alkalihalobacillus sp. MEB130]|uniref:AraC family transcriptional regulator n=1 Tax=Alkalihalobacillus sp. MEB130 TaxID=2976704 RepID=UPI0028DD67BE|nr:helix-turn-helix domain-containing protein [Alkalihalobacillus sp. MEB130]MDT8861940.1 helix-turn-helix domain-containing protein [Alkalihalobacillus sp. MEB130]